MPGRFLDIAVAVHALAASASRELFAAVQRFYKS
jgi:hypothetical protein